MKVLKFAGNDAASKCISDAFDRVVVKEPLSFDRIELHIGHGCTSLASNTAKLFIDSSAGMFKECDEKIAETAVRFELFRVLVKKVYSIPRITEDVIVGREMIRKGFSDDLARMLHAFAVSQNVIDLNSYVRFNLPYIIFYNNEFQSGFFKSIADKKRNKQYDKLAQNLFDALQKDLQNEKLLNEAVRLEMKMHADNQI